MEWAYPGVACAMVTSATAAPPRVAAPSPPLERGRYLQLVLVLGALIALGPLTIDMYLPAFPALADDLRASEAAVQATLTATLVGLGLGQLLIGPFSDAVGRRLPLLLGVTGHVVTSVLCALAPTIEVLTVARVLQGLSGAAVSVVAMATVRDLFSGIAAAKLLSRLMLVMGVAPVVAPTLGGFVLGVTSWRGVFVTLAVLGLVLLGVAALGLRETLPVERRRSARPSATLRTYRTLLRDGPFVALAVAGGLMFATMFAYVAGSPFVLQGVYGLDERTFALVFGLNAVALVTATQVNPLLLRWFSLRQVLTTAMAVAATAALTLVVVTAAGVQGLVWVLVPLAVITACAGLSFPNTPALALSRHGEAAGTAAALLGAAQFTIAGFSAPLVGLLGTSSALPMAAVMAGATTTALVLLLAVRGERVVVRERVAA